MYKCPECPRITYYKRDLKKHLMIHYRKKLSSFVNKEDLKSAYCEECGKQFRDHADLTYHFSYVHHAIDFFIDFGVAQVEAMKAKGVVNIVPNAPEVRDIKKMKCGTSNIVPVVSGVRKDKSVTKLPQGRILPSRNIVPKISAVKKKKSLIIP
jgi:hypothetical protein